MSQTESEDDVSDTAEDKDPIDNKVVRLVAQYEPDAITAELERSWTATGAERRSLRDMADYFNQQLLERWLADESQQTLKGRSRRCTRCLPTRT